MNNKKSTKRALTSSVLSLVLCMAMLIGTTFAWFTDNASTSVNTIQSGKLDIALEYSTDNGATWSNAEGKTLNFMAADNREDILWEPGCTYELPLIRVRNNGNLALKYKLNINGVTGNAKLLEAIEFTANGNAISEFSGTLLTEDAVSETILLKGHMKEEAGNEYQELSITGIGITVSATQYTYESDSYDNQYDAFAEYDGEISSAASLKAALTKGGTYKVTADVVADEVMQIPEGVTVNLDLNGNDISSAMAKDAGDLIVNNGILTIAGDSDSLITNTTTNGGALIYNKGTLTLKGGNYVGAPIGTTDYPDYAVYSTGKLVIEDDTSITSDRGILNVSGETIINGGKFVVTSAASSRTLTCHTVYASGSTLTINGGTFENNYSGVSGASVICPAGATITINDGTFRDAIDDTSNFNNTANFQNYMGYGKPVVVYGGSYDDTTVNKNLAKGYTTIKNSDGTYSVVKGVVATDSVALENAIKSGEKEVVLSAGTYKFPTIPAGTTIIGQAGVVFEDTLSGTLDDVTIKNVHIKANNAQRWANSNGTLVFENCTFEATGTYAIHYDSLNGANITYKNCTIIGWAAIGGGAEYVTFDGCKIYGNGTYGVIRLYSPGTIKNCTFDVSNVNTTDVYQDGIHAVDCEIKVSNNTNVNGSMDEVYNLSGTGTIVEK